LRNVTPSILALAPQGKFRTLPLRLPSTVLFAAPAPTRSTVVTGQANSST